MKRKWKAKRSCKVCNGTGYFTNPFDQTFRCDCYKKTKAYKNRNRMSERDVALATEIFSFGKYR